MKLYLDIQDFDIFDQPENLHQNSVFVIGKLDGIHLGHQALILSAQAFAKKHNLLFGVLTFHPHPLHLFAPNAVPAKIYTLEDKYQLLSNFDVDCIVDQYFHQDFADLSPETFIHELLIKKLRVKQVFVGYDFAFGKKRKGTLDDLKMFGETLGFSVHISTMQTIDIYEEILNPTNPSSEKFSESLISKQLMPLDDFGKSEIQSLSLAQRTFSSSIIREWILSKKITLANLALGRHFHLRGKVVAGFGRGKKLGFPTANLSLESELCPKQGVYAVWLSSPQYKTLPAIVNIGVNPTFNQGHLLENQQKYSIEVHVFSDEPLDLYGQSCLLHFERWIRDEKKFDSIDLLKTQIQIDCQQARSILKQAIIQPSWPSLH
jgi:riboflavin kinase/FMN adenylyltransferase